ncbi:hypothetical protein [Mangrovactinospora gilvigrisea]|uniref:hypothetical protein n=1 Tax=Mangrovactinospora gilvigrisea TaxID=1428644 RepID=UPI0009A0E609|nr:hypothetical protein [Mangrovactinospora gilvigrisea]
MLIPTAICNAHQRAASGHAGVATATLEAYGCGLHAAQFEELAAALEPLPGAQPRSVRGRAVIVLDRHAFYPMRVGNVGKTNGRPSPFRVEFTRRYGPEPLQEPLEGMPETPEEIALREGVGVLPEDTRLVLVAYVCALQTGLTELRWGRAELDKAGTITWHRGS